MNISVLRRQFLFATAALIVSMALPVHARVLRAYTFQTDMFRIANNATIVVGANHKASLADLKVGDRVSVGYEKENNVLVAHRISDGVPHKAPNTSTNNTGASSSVKTHSHAKGETLLHVHGVVRAVDIASGTVTVAHRLR
jgi:Cu/Ag efflux protein CusF